METMMDKRSTFGLRLDQLAGLFALGAEGPVDMPEGRQKMTEMLEEHLTAALPTGVLVLDALMMMVRRLGYETQPLAGRTLKEVLLDRQSDIGLLRAIKECSKRLSLSLESKAEAAIATTLYYAAMASALVHHGQKITQHSRAALAEAFALLKDKPWMEPDLAALFSQAHDICQAKEGPK
jgi:hypothetical protein